MPGTPFKVFISYSHRDMELRKELDRHLRMLNRQNIISTWTDSDISPGTEWKPQIMENLNNAQIILLLISADFIDSEFCYSIEMEKALARHKADKARVIPIILRPVYWEIAPFGKLQALPSGGKAVTLWNSRDEAFRNIAEGIVAAVDDLKQKGKQTSP